LVDESAQRDGDRRRWEPSLVFAASAAVLVLYALRGGSFDVVPRSELGIAAWWAIALGWAFGVLPRARLERAAALPVAGLVLLAAWTALSLRWTESDERTVLELARIAHHAGFLVLALSLLSRDTWRAAVYGAASGALAICALAVASRLWPGAFHVDAVGASFGIDRLSYPLNYWNAVGAWAAISATVALTLSAHAVRPAVRMLALAAVPVAVLATYLTYSRAGLAGLALGAAVAWAASRHRVLLAAHFAVAGMGAGVVIAIVRRHPELAGDGRGAVLVALGGAAVLGAVTAWVTWRLGADARWRFGARSAHRLTAAGAVLAIAAGALALPPAVPGALRAFRTPVAINAPADDPAARLGSLSGTRVLVWSSALDAFRAHPFNGTGAGTYEFWWSRDARASDFVVDAHSLYLEPLAELGLPGLAFVLLLCGGGVAICIRARVGAGSGAEAGAAAACVAGLTVWLFQAGVDWLWESTATVALALLLVAAAAASRSRPAPPPRVPVRVLVCAIALLAVAVQLPPLAGVSALRASQAAAREHDDRHALAAAGDAAAILPWAASPHIQLALLAESRGDLAVAEREARDAIALEPTNWSHPLLLARVLAERGDAPAALAAFVRARELRPQAKVFRTAGF
jgi:hypothetical protein